MTQPIIRLNLFIKRSTFLLFHIAPIASGCLYIDKSIAQLKSDDLRFFESFSPQLALNEFQPKVLAAGPEPVSGKKFITEERKRPLTLNGDTEKGSPDPVNPEARTEEPVDTTLVSGAFKSYNSFIDEPDWKGRLLGRPAGDHLYLGMWTLHFQSGDDQQNTNDLLGITWNGYYAGTFINTHNDRTWTAGWHRTLFQQKYGEIGVEAGYRAGMMYGYKKYLRLGDSRFFPLLQAVMDIDYKGFGIQLSWAGVVLTAGFSYRF